MGLNRDQIVEALSAFHNHILSSKLSEEVTESEMMAVVDAVTLIRDLDKELFEAHTKNVELLKENAQLRFFDLPVTRDVARYFKEQYLKVETDTVKKLLDYAIDHAVCKDNGDGTERLFISIAELRKAAQELLEEL